MLSGGNGSRGQGNALPAARNPPGIRSGAVVGRGAGGTGPAASGLLPGPYQRVAGPGRADTVGESEPGRSRAGAGQSTGGARLLGAERRPARLAHAYRAGTLGDPLGADAFLAGARLRAGGTPAAGR